MARRARSAMAAVAIGSRPGSTERELLAAVAGHGVADLGDADEHVAHPAQHLVTGEVAVRVVERLEAVEVDEDEAEGRAVGLGQAELVGQGGLELAPVGQAGEVVGDRELLDVVQEPGVAQGERGVGGELLEGGDDAALDPVAARCDRTRRPARRRAARR